MAGPFLLSSTLFCEALTKEYGIQPKSVESNIRTVSAVAWATDPVRLKKVAGFSLHGQPSAVEFIEIFSNYMQRKDMKETVHS